MEDSLRTHAERRIGSVIKGKYRIDRVLGMGGMAVVYAATHVRNGAELALKMLHPELSIRDDIRQRFLREGYAGNSVKHPGVVKVVDDDTSEDNAAFIVMEMLAGAPVDALCDRNGGTLPILAAVAIIDQLLDVLRVAHEKGVVHRDIKPANLFVTTDGAVKVLDFGIARVRDALASSGVQQTSSGVLMGTPAFMSPEQALAKSSEIDGQSDVWAAGATLYTLISGRYVHEADNGPQMLVKAATQPAPSLSTVAAGVPAPIVAVVAKALAFDKASRYPSAAAMRQALRDAAISAFGVAPGRDVLDQLFGAADSAHTHLSAVPLVGAKAPAVGSEPRAAGTGTLLVAARAQTPLPLTGGSTEQPVSSAQPIPLRAAGPKVSRLPLFVGGGLAVAIVIGLAAVGVKSSSMHTTAEAPSASSSTTASVSALAQAPAAPATTAPAPSVSITLPTIPTATHSGKPTTAPASSTKPVPVPSASASAKPIASAAAPSCDPPYFFDATGKHYKKECL